MAKRKAGRVRCGRCQRVLYDPTKGERAPRRGEVDTINAMEQGLEKGAALYRSMTRPAVTSDNAYFSAATHGDEAGVDDSVVLFVCPGAKCEIQYRVSDYRAKLAAAVSRGEDLILTASQRE